MNINFPIIELVDRYTIAQLKFEKTNGKNKAELEFYENQIKMLEIEKFGNMLSVLKELHKEIWSLEDDFKKCRLENVDLAEIGKRALRIRDLNNLRIIIKNLIAENFNDPVKDVKTTL